MPPDAVFAGPTAAWMHGLDLEGNDFVEVGVTLKSGIRYKDGLSVRHLIFEPGDVTTIRGLSVTTIHRTLRDLCVRGAATLT